MTLSITFYNNIKYSKDDFMNRDRDLFGNGVLREDHFPLTLPAEPGMEVDVGAGVAWVDGYRIANDAQPIRLTVEPADLLPRIDIVQIGHDDNLQRAVLQVKKGVPGANPIEPGADPSFYKLHAIRVEPLVTEIVEEDIIDRRDLVPLKVSGAQIQYNGAATVEANTFTGSQTAPSFVATDEAAPLQLPARNELPAIVGPEGAVCIVGERWFISDGARWNDMVPPPPIQAVYSLPNLVDPTQMTFTRNTEAHTKNLQRTPIQTMRTEQGKFGQAAFLEEGTTNLVCNSDFETVTGTGVMFSDSFANGDAWKIAAGTGTFGATGLVAVNDTFVTGGHSQWRPLTGSNGQSLELTAQATFVTGTNVSTGFVSLSLLPNSGSSSNRYSAEVSLEDKSFYIARGINDVASLIGTSSPYTFSPNSTYTIVLSINTANLLTAKLYSGEGTNGSLLATASVTDTTFPANSTDFQLGLFISQGNRVTACSVTAPQPDGWTVSGDRRVAWALTTNAINGALSLSVKGVAAGVSGHVYSQNISISQGAGYTIQGRAASTEEGQATGAYLELDFHTSNTYINKIDTTSSRIKGTTSAKRYSASGTAGNGADGARLCLIQSDAGVVVFDSVQVERRAYATTYMRNDSTNSTATRAAESLSYTLADALPKNHFAALVWRPEQSSGANGTGIWDKTLLSTTDRSRTAFRHLLHYVTRENTTLGTPANTFQLAKKKPDDKWEIVCSDPITYQAGDTIFAAYLDDPLQGTLTLWIGINGGALKRYSVTTSVTWSDVSTVYVGSRYDNLVGYEANGTIDYPLVTGIVPTDEQVEALYRASDWGGLRHVPGILPQQASIGKTTKISEAPKGVAQFSKPIVGTGIVMSATPLGNTYTTSNARYDEAADAWFRVDPSRTATMAATYPGGMALYHHASVDAGNKVTGWNIYQVLQAVNGGYKVQSGTIAWTTARQVTFPVKYAAGTVPAVFVTPKYNNAWSGVMPMIDLVWQDGACIGFNVYLYTAGGTQASGVAYDIHWMAIGI